MRVVVPTNSRKGLNDEVAEHFGRCRTYTFLDENGKVLEVINNTSEHMGGSGLPPALMKEHGADVLLCKGIGLRAMNLCRDLGIAVFVCNARTVKEMFGLWKSKKIKKAGTESACKH